jgi:putative heme-binding domain-containing protein
MSLRHAVFATTMLVGMVLAAGLLSAQHEYKPADVEEGARLFLANCAQCHGAEGDGVPGVDLGHGQFRRTSTDAGLIQIIRTGIPGMGMPPTNLPEELAGTIVAYLRSLATSDRNASVPGDAARGRALFDGKGGCLTCHRVNGNGSRLGPDLSDIGLIRRAPELERSLLDPGAEVLPQNRSVRVVTRDGVTTTGRLLNHDSFILALIDSKEQLRSFLKSNIREYAFVENTSMPSYRQTLSQEELGDVIRYLVSLRGIKVSTVEQ